MVTSRELQSLLGQLRGVRSPVQRMKLVALAWRTLQRLTPGERNEIAREMGIRGIGGILERLGRRHDGIAPAEMLRVLERAEDLDPSRVDELVAGLRDPERRRGILKRGLAFLQEQVGGPDEGERAQDTVGGEEGVAERTGAATASAAETPRGTPAVVDGDAPASSTRPAAVPRPGEPQGKRQVTTAPGIVEPPPREPEAASPRPARPPVPDEAPEAPIRPAAPDVAIPWATFAAGSRPRPVPPIPAAEADRGSAPLREALRSASSLVARLRLLRERVEEAGDLDVDGLRAILAELPSGWPRRRALTAWLRAGVPARLDDALALIDDLDRPADRAWCVKALVDAVELDDGDLRRLGERFPSPSVRRHLLRASG